MYKVSTLIARIKKFYSLRSDAVSYEDRWEHILSRAEQFGRDARLVSKELDWNIIENDTSRYGDWYRRMTFVFWDRQDEARDRLRALFAEDDAREAVIKAGNLDARQYHQRCDDAQILEQRAAA
ncbi:hypothetical protein [Yanghanlia caeni]|uniref:Uncharacterized protein n=1 Tax=Yanghanlia caeni TaxID=3064283 RepID=A0ABU1D9F1_9BURK|nr:hypothetical protein [Alcaligenaceae bacterium LG-2]